MGHTLEYGQTDGRAGCTETLHHGEREMAPNSLKAEILLFFLQYWGFEFRACACQAGTLPPE
jgi:hypothetical protein